MSATFYNNMAATASKLLSKFGAVGTIKRTTGGSINPVTGAIVTGTTVTYSPKTIVQRYANELVDGTRVLSSDRLIILDKTIEPLTSDKITIDSEDWSIVSVTESKPAGIALVYFVQARR